MFDNTTDILHRRLSSWRRSAGMVEPAIESQIDAVGIRSHMAVKNSLLRALLLDVITELDTTFSSVEDSLEEGIRSPLTEQRLNERSAAAIQTYERAVARLLEQGIHDTLYEDMPRIREVIKTETIFVAAPPVKGWLARLFRW